MANIMIANAKNSFSLKLIKLLRIVILTLIILLSLVLIIQNQILIQKNHELELKILKSNNPINIGNMFSEITEKVARYYKKAFNYYEKQKCNLDNEYYVMRAKRTGDLSLLDNFKFC